MQCGGYGTVWSVWCSVESMVQYREVWLSMMQYGGYSTVWRVWYSMEGMV